MITDRLSDLKQFLISKIAPAPASPPDEQSFIEAYNLVRPESLRKSFCYAPSVNMLFSQDGSVKACCHNLYYSMGSYPQQTIKEIWTSTEADELRKYMEATDLTHGCTLCEADLKRGSFEEISANHFDRVPQHPKYPTMMEFLLTNTCNLECVMCKGEFSSSIRKNREKLPALINPYDENFFEQLKEFIPHLHETRFSGSGEAFSIEMNFRIWEMIIELNPTCIMMVQTNGTYMNSRIKDILEKGNFEIGISLDSLNEETYEAIRLNSNFEKVIENIRYFREYTARKKTRFSLAMCAMQQNWHELPEFIKFCNSLEAIATLHKVWHPEEYAIHNLPAAKLVEIYNYLRSFDFKVGGYVKAQNKRHYQYFVQVVKEWMDTALAKIKAKDKMISISQKELMRLIKSTLSTQIKSPDSTIPPQDQQAILSFCISMVEKTLKKFPAKEDKKLALAALNNVSADKIVDLLNTTDEESLYQKAANSVEMYKE